jgi:hypothetical protein
LVHPTLLNVLITYATKVGTFRLISVTQYFQKVT